MTFSIPLIGPRDAFEAIFAEMEKRMIELGKKVRDTITEFTGIATGRAVYLGGHVSVRVEPLVNVEGKCLETWITESRLELVAD